ncbi:hypothetical protein ACFFOS_27480 [Nocardioides kongjuensis]|uniref:Lsr2 DNA-binding domain-containing protein n=1 Tax=Nocardioides kongjuensis TaxID=349522 RepID=A0A852RFI0_9ACTN|nr:hypothetical protein [Nocardioides kongjuensis]NYD33863.1 hypothetical protein [Nocardioides kongjuensis]
MSGVRTGTRLQQLHALRHRVTVELEYAARQGTPTARLRALLAATEAEIQAETPPPVATRTATEQDPRRRPPLPVDLRLAQLGVTTATVRAWAVEQGLVEPGRRGRVPLAVVDAYAAHQRTLAHYNQKAGTP